MAPGYLIDIDGVVKIGDRPIPEAVDFLSELQARSIPFLLVTNNSTKTQEAVRSDMEKIGVSVEPDRIVTSSMVAADFISEMPGGQRAMMVGEEGLRDTLLSRGIDIVNDFPDYVVVGLDWNFNYYKMKRASLAIRGGASFIATNTDATFPLPEGLVPGAGALVESIRTASGEDPIVMGKPHLPIFELSISLLEAKEKDIVMIGDRYDTDIIGAMNANIRSIMVTTGVSNRDNIPKDGPLPHRIVQSLSEIDPEGPL